MRITSAQFIKGVVTGSYDIDAGIPQVVLYGRSNAGKSTTVNNLTGRNALARASHTPGRTKEVNIFLINKTWHLIDMPGYGYAKASKTDIQKIHRLITWFIRETNAAQRLNVMIVDSKIGLTDLDREILGLLTGRHEPIVILLNKIDRINQSSLTKVVRAVQSELGDTIPVVPCASRTGKGMHVFETFLENFLEK
jgi:GTP-binding protein